LKHRVELVTDKDCPNAEAAREQLRRALEDAGLPLEWEEWDRESPEAPAHVRQYGSPTILVGGHDVAGEGTQSAAKSCRVYQTGEGVRGVPSVEMIVAALQYATGKGRY